MQFPTGLASVLGMMLLLSFLVIIHELGHFFAAKWAKIKVLEFGLGYPPRAATLFSWAETIFSLNWVPFGGFVRMEGEDQVQFYQHAAGRRLVVILAGAAVNIVFGVLAFSIFFSITGIPELLPQVRISQVLTGSPAEAAHLPTEVAVLEITQGSDKKIVTSVDQFLAAIKQWSGQTVTIMASGPCQADHCSSDTKNYTVKIRTPQETPAGQGELGVKIYQPSYQRFFPWYEMPVRGVLIGLKQAYFLAILFISLLVKMFSDLLLHGVVPQDIAGPVGIVSQAHQAGIFNQGLMAIVYFAGIISFQLGVMNLLPIPALDGGRAVFIALEKILGQHRVAKYEGYVNYGGMIFLISLIILITVRDIAKLF